jgi:hypothetical protein
MYVHTFHFDGLFLWVYTHSPHFMLCCCLRDYAFIFMLHDLRKKKYIRNLCSVVCMYWDDFVYDVIFWVSSSDDETQFWVLKILIRFFCELISWLMAFCLNLINNSHHWHINPHLHSSYSCVGLFIFLYVPYKVKKSERK